MTIVTKKYIRKPLIVDAVQVTADNLEELAHWCQGEVRSQDESDKRKYVHVRVHNPRSPRQTKAFVGDWILYTEMGYKIYNSKSFYGTFEVYTS